MHKLMATTVVALSILSAPAVGAQESPVLPGDRVTVELVSLNGSGCRVGSAAVAAADDNSGFTITYSGFLAETGPHAEATASRKNCQLGVNVHTPDGYAYAVTKVDHRGYAYLAPGATGLQRASYYIQGSSGTARTTAHFEGPAERNWTVTDEVPVEQLVWSECGSGRLLNVNTEVRVNPGESNRQDTSYMTMDSTDGTAHTEFQVSWKRC